MNRKRPVQPGCHRQYYCYIISIGQHRLHINYASNGPQLIGKLLQGP